MAVSSSAGKVFGWFANMVCFLSMSQCPLITIFQTAIAGLMTWFGICVTYVRFYAGTKAQGIDRSTLPYASKLQPYAAWYGLVSTIIICFFSGFAVFLKDCKYFASS